jgi:hypothetical protein
MCVTTKLVGNSLYNKRFENNIPLIERELQTSDRDPAAVIFNYGFTFSDDIRELYLYAQVTKRVLVVKAIRTAFPDLTRTGQQTLF